MTKEAPAGRERLAALAVAIVTLGALLLRLYRVGEQSVWVDEWYTYAPLGAPSLKSYLTIVRFYCPDNVPLYFIAQYLWALLVGTASIPWLRMLSIIPGVACVPLLYALGAALYGRRAGLIAALCLALSPMHIWVAQSARPNALIEFLVLVSILALMKAADGRGRGWWIVHTAANLLLVWLHPFLVFFFAPEGAYLLSRGRRMFPKTVCWGVVHVLIALSPLIWLWPTMKSVQNANEDFYMTVPGAGPLAADFLADDAVMLSDPFSFQGTTWPCLPTQVQNAVVAAHGVFDKALIGAFGAAACWLAVRLARRATKPRGAAANHELLMALVAFLPLAILLGLSFVWRPCILPRYTSYSSMALYVIAGGALAAIPYKPLRAMALAALLALYGYQLSLALPAATRSDWLSAAARIKAEAHPNDVVLVKGIYLAWDIFRFAAGGRSTQALPAYTLEEIAEKGSQLCQGDRAVWAVIEPFVLTLPPLEVFEKNLAARGLQYTSTVYPGMNGIFVYKIQRAPAVTPATSPPPAIEGSPFDPQLVLHDLGLNDRPAAEREKALAAFRRARDCEFPPTRYFYTLFAWDLAGQGELALAEKAARRAIELDPHYAFGHFALAVILGEEGRRTEGGKAFANAVANDDYGYFRFFERAYAAQYQEGDAATASAELRRLDTWGAYIPHVWRMHAIGW